MEFDGPGCVDLWDLCLLSCVTAEFGMRGLDVSAGCEREKACLPGPCSEV